MSNVVAVEAPVEMQLEVAYHFCAPIYSIKKPEFLPTVNVVSEEYLEEHRKQLTNEIYPFFMSNNYHADHRVADFANFVGSTAWNILAEQGYDMYNKTVAFTEMWTQEHYKCSGMEQHTHNNGSQIVGFYFLTVPDNASRLVFHDPRVAKTMIDLPQTDVSRATISSSMINFEPKPGLLIFSNSWLAHSFTRHASDEPIKFVHFNLVVQQAHKASFCLASAEVI